MSLCACPIFFILEIKQVGEKSSRMRTLTWDPKSWSGCVGNPQVMLVPAWNSGFVIAELQHHIFAVDGWQGLLIKSSKHSLAACPTTPSIKHRCVTICPPRTPHPAHLPLCIPLSDKPVAPVCRARQWLREQGQVSGGFGVEGEVAYAYIQPCSSPPFHS